MLPSCCLYSVMLPVMLPLWSCGAVTPDDHFARPEMHEACRLKYPIGTPGTVRASYTRDSIVDRFGLLATMPCTEAGLLAVISIRCDALYRMSTALVLCSALLHLALRPREAQGTWQCGVNVKTFMYQVGLTAGLGKLA